MQRPVGGTPPGGDLQARNSFRRLRKSKAASRNSCGGKKLMVGEKMEKSFIIDSLPDCAKHYRSGYAVVAIDVIRATTMAITAVDAGRQCYPVDSIEAAFRLAPMLRNPLFAGEINGSICPGLEMNNSPRDL